MVDQNLKFTVDSQLLGELGEHLVTHNYIALAELIKNAYDSDANHLIIRFINAKKESGAQLDQSEIQLIDDGHGMTFQEIRDYWMRVATSIKKRFPVSPKYKRLKTGNKGIGRFACRRLANKLIIESTAKIPNTSQYEHTQVVFNWEDFKEGTTLTDIPCKYVTHLTEEKKSGTILRLIGLTEYWSENEFTLLRRQVLQISIAGAVKRKDIEDPGFQIKLDAKEFSEGEGDLADQFMDAGWGTLLGHVDDTGKVSLTLNAKNIEEKKFELPNLYPLISGIDYRIAWIPGLKEYFRNPKLLTVEKAKKILTEQSGVRVYYNGFRVYPYGEPNNDWLEIDRDYSKRSGATDPILKTLTSKLGVDPTKAMLNHPPNKQLIGVVKISSDKTNQFIMKIDREGFIENEAYNSLRNVIKLSLEWMVVYYVKHKSFVLEEELKEAKEDFKNKSKLITNEKTLSQSDKNVDKNPMEESRTLLSNASKVIQLEVKRMAESSQLSEKEKKESEEAINSALIVYQKSYDNQELYGNILGAVASTGMLMFVYTHEIRNLTNKLETHAKTIKRLAQDLPQDKRKEFEEFSGSLSQTKKRFEQHIKMFGLMAQKTSDLQRKEINLKDAVVEVVNNFEYLCDYYQKNKPEIDIPDNLYTKPMLDAEVYSILVNLISNAFKAILASSGKKILIEAKPENGNTVIRVYDDGIGLANEYRKIVFQPLSSDPDGTLYKGLKDKVLDDDLTLLGKGSGLGLSIINSMIEPYKGYARFIDAKPPYKTCIEVVLP